MLLAIPEPLPVSLPPVSPPPVSPPPEELPLVNEKSSKRTSLELLSCLANTCSEPVLAVVKVLDTFVHEETLNFSLLNKPLRSLMPICPLPSTYALNVY